MFSVSLLRKIIIISYVLYYMIVVNFVAGMIKRGLSATQLIRITKARQNKSFLPHRTIMESWL